MQVKETALRTYLLVYGNQYGRVALRQMVDLFELTERQVYRVVSTMIVNEQLQGERLHKRPVPSTSARACAGSWDEPNKLIVVHCAEPSRLQKATLRYTDKVCPGSSAACVWWCRTGAFAQVGLFVEQNEKLMDGRGFELEAEQRGARLEERLVDGGVVALRLGDQLHQRRLALQPQHVLLRARARQGVRTGAGAAARAAPRTSECESMNLRLLMNSP